MSTYCVIGSGISGATIANLLNNKHSVDLYDKARGPGGRSSFKRLDQKIGFDHGVQYISPKSDEFKKFTAKLLACLLYTSPSPRDYAASRMPSSA